jgi:hypothetical protein
MFQHGIRQEKGEKGKRRGGESFRARTRARTWPPHPASVMAVGFCGIPLITVNSVR